MIQISRFPIATLFSGTESSVIQGPPVPTLPYQDVNVIQRLIEKRKSPSCPHLQLCRSRGHNILTAADTYFPFMNHEMS